MTQTDSIWRSAHVDSLDELDSFGQLLLNEVQQRSAQLDTKLTTMLGLSGAMMAFLLIGNELWSANALHGLRGLFWYRIALGVAILLGLVSVAFCYVGLRLREWIVPSEKDWVKQDLLSAPEKLKRFHIISMLEVHSAHNQNNAKKAKSARVAELLLLVSVAIVGITLMSRVIQQLIS